MPSRQRVEKTPPHKVDVMGIAVALAFLVSVGVLAGGRDNPDMSEDGQSSSPSMHIPPALTMEKSEVLQHPNDEADLSDLSPKLSAPR
jgi:hypothetical protein